MWNRNEGYCTFPNLTVTSSSEVKSILISYPNEEESGSSEIVATVKQGITLNGVAGRTAAFFDVSSDSELENFLRETKYYCKADQLIDLTLSKTQVPSNAKFFGETGHFYGRVGGMYDWSEFYVNALQQNLGGWKGYVATITSQRENDFVRGVLSGYGWIGATSISINDPNGDPPFPEFSMVDRNYNYLYWACGPESIFKPNNPNWSTNTIATKKESKDGQYLSHDSTNSVFYGLGVVDKPVYTGVKHYTYTGLADGLDFARIGALVHLGGSSGWYLERWSSSSFDRYECGGVVEFGDRLYGNSTPLNDSTVFTQEVNVKPTPPKINTSNWYNISTPTISVTGEPGCTVKIKNANVTKEVLIGEKGNIALTLPQLPNGNHQFAAVLVDKEGNTSNETPFTINIDTIVPYCVMEVVENPVLDLLSSLTLNLFKQQTTIKITCSDSLSGVKEMHYFKSNSNFSSYDLANNVNWESVNVIHDQENPFTATITVNPDEWDKGKFNESFFIYVKIQDNAGNCAYVKSDGVVVYKESTAITEEISFSGQPVSVAVNLNGNTINKIQRRGEETLSLGSDYKVSDTAITFNPTYLNTLDVGEYFFDIFYNPAGIVPENEESLHKTSLKINILKQTTDEIDVSGATAELEEIPQDSELYKNSEEKLKEKFKGNIENTTIYKANAVDKDGNKIPNGTKLDEEFRIPLPYDFDKQKIYLLTSLLEKDDLKAEILKENGTPEDTGTDIIKENDGYVLVIKGYYVGEYFTILTF